RADANAAHLELVCAGEDAEAIGALVVARRAELVEPRVGRVRDDQASRVRDAPDRGRAAELARRRPRTASKAADRVAAQRDGYVGHLVAEVLRDVEAVVPVRRRVGRVVQSSASVVAAGRSGGAVDVTYGNPPSAR